MIGVARNGLRAAARQGVAGLCLPLVLLAGPALAEGKQALVIANSDYRWADAPGSSTEDSAAVANALRDRGFEVEEVADLGLYDLLVAIRNFQRGSRDADVSVIYYSGYGITADDKNFIIPVTASLDGALEVLFETVPLDRAIAAVETARTAGIVILDSSRPNPFIEKLRRNPSNGDIPDGMAALLPRGRTFVALSAEPGRMALDGDGGLSPYAEALVAELGASDAPLLEVLAAVSDRVAEATGGAQLPVLYEPENYQPGTALPDEGEDEGAAEETPVAEAPAEPVAPAPEPEGPVLALTPPGERPTEDIPFWVSIVGSENPDDYRAYLDAFPNGVFASTARRIYASLGGGGQQPAPQVEAPPSVDGTLPQEPTILAIPFDTELPETGDDAPPLVTSFAPIAPEFTAPGDGDVIAGLPGVTPRRLEIEITPELGQPEETAAAAPEGDPDGPPTTTDLATPEADAVPEVDLAAAPSPSSAISPPVASGPVTAPPTPQADGTSFDMAALPPSDTASAPALPPSVRFEPPAIDLDSVLAAPADPDPAEAAPVDEGAKIPDKTDSAPETEADPAKRPSAVVVSLAPVIPEYRPVAVAPRATQTEEPALQLAALPRRTPVPRPVLPEPLGTPEPAPGPIDEPEAPPPPPAPEAAQEQEQDQEQAPEPAQVAEVPQIEINRETVRNVQVSLNALGFDAGPADGLVGRRTRAGVSAFEAANGMPETGEITAELVYALSQKISTDRTLFYVEVVDRFRRSARNSDIAGAYCLQNPDGSLADGLDQRDLICHYIRPLSQSVYELRSYYSHIRDPQGQRILPIVSQFRRTADGTLVDQHGSRITFSPEGIRVDNELYAASPPLS